MRGAVFEKLFPHYHLSRFIVDENEVDFVRESDGIVVAVDDEFFKKMAYTKFLGISRQDQVFLRTHGIEKYKVLKGAVDPVQENREFHRRYQHDLDADLMRRKQQEEDQRHSEQKIQQEERAYQQEQQQEIQHQQEQERQREKELRLEELQAERQAEKILAENKELAADLKKWQPRLWSNRGTIPPEIQKSSSPVEIFKFSVYVNDSAHFPSQFQPLSIQWKSKTQQNILEEKFDVKKDPYFCSLGAAFTISYKCGFSQEHFQTPGIAGSLARYAVYFHLSRFLTFPNTLILSDVEIAEIQRNMPVRKVWSRDKFVHTQEIPALWLQQQKNKANIRNVRADYYADGGGQMGIYYDEVKKVVPEIEDEDWQKLIREKSNGFTMFGQKLLQQAIESFTYAILGAQAKTRWKITGKDAKASQTQDVFRQLVKDTIVELDSTKAISNMRTAIQDTNVRLDLVVSPGVSLLPSNMILARKIPGFNNILTLASTNMKFGKNTDINIVPRKPSSSSPEQKPRAAEEQKSSSPEKSVSGEKPQKPSVMHEPPESNTLSYVFVGVVISLITKFIVLEVF